MHKLNRDYTTYRSKATMRTIDKAIIVSSAIVLALGAIMAMLITG